MLAQNVYLWEGKYSSAEEKKYAASVMAQLGHDAKARRRRRCPCRRLFKCRAIHTNYRKAER